MARFESEPSLAASLLDRLLDEDPTQTKEPPGGTRHDVRRLKKSIARDLELLLNTRMELLDPLPDGYSEATRSILTYGLPDLTLLTASSHKDRNKVRRIIEQAVDIFEPRLKNVRVIVDQPRERERVLTFRIEAVIPVEPTPELVAFDTDFQLFSRKYVVKGNA